MNEQQLLDTRVDLLERKLKKLERRVANLEKAVKRPKRLAPAQGVWL
jgi:hypothetical protein